MILMESILLSLTGGVVGTVGAVGADPHLGPAARRGRHDRHPHRPRRDRARDSSSRLCVGLLGAAYPAYRGAQLLPTEALRHE